MVFLRKMPRGFALVLTVLAIFAASVILTAGVSAQQTSDMTRPTLYITVKPGGEPREYRAVVSAVNNPGIAGFNLALGFDRDKLRPLTIEEGDDSNGGLVFISNLTGATTEQTNAMSAVTAVWAATSDIAADGELYAVTFRSEPRAVGLTELSLVSRGIGNIAENLVEFDLLGATIDLNKDLNGGLTKIVGTDMGKSASANLDGNTGSGSSGGASNATDSNADAGLSGSTNAESPNPQTFLLIALIVLLLLALLVLVLLLTRRQRRSPQQSQQ